MNEESRRLSHNQVGLRKERRRFRREKISPHLKVHLLDTGTTFGAFITNISKGGVEVYTDHPIPEGARARLSISFTTPPGQGTEEVVEAQVRWTKSFGTRLLAGMAFQNLSPQQQPILWEVLEFAEEKAQPHPSGT